MSVLLCIITLTGSRWSAYSHCLTDMVLTNQVQPFISSRRVATICRQHPCQNKHNKVRAYALEAASISDCKLLLYNFITMQAFPSIWLTP